MYKLTFNTLAFARKMRYISSLPVRRYWTSEIKKVNWSSNFYASSIVDSSRTIISASHHSIESIKCHVMKLGGEKRYDSKWPGGVPVSLLAFMGLFGAKKDEEEEDELVMTIKRSILLIQQGDLPKAERMLHLALRIAQQTQNAEGITYVYDLLANVALENGEHEKAEKLFVNVMQRLLGDGVAQDDNKIIHMSLKLAEIYVMRSDQAGYDLKAEEGFRFCMDALEKKIAKGVKDEDTLLLASVAAEGQGKMLAQKGQFKEARTLIEKALELSDLSQADIPERQAGLMSDLGAISSMGGDDDAALKFLKQAVELGRQAQMEMLPAFLTNLGLLSVYKGLESEARMACKEAWNISRSQKNKDTEKEAAMCLDEVFKMSKKK